MTFPHEYLQPKSRAKFTSNNKHKKRRQNLPPFIIYIGTEISLQ